MKGILMSPPMLQALRDRRKTVTRRLSGLEEVNKEPDQWVLSILTEDGRYGFANRFDPRHLLREPPYLPGETVYVKEAWAVSRLYDNLKPREIDHDSPVWYQPNREYATGKWRSPMFLPEHFARSFLHIESVRPERLQEITEEDAEAEGAGPMYESPRGGIYILDGDGYRRGYHSLWDSINKKPGTRWGDNPYVWRIEFAPEGKK